MRKIWDEAVEKKDKKKKDIRHSHWHDMTQSIRAQKSRGGKEGRK